MMMRAAPAVEQQRRWPEVKVMGADVPLLKMATCLMTKLALPDINLCIRKPSRPLDCKRRRYPKNLAREQVRR